MFCYFLSEIFIKFIAWQKINKKYLVESNGKSLKYIKENLVKDRISIEFVISRKTFSNGH